ncbi:aldehyde dehydrogenase family protein [Rhodoplanes sp. Z2-YC6860]|uniref:aldehyde dehydrogenase family protein n=1 Tax=Rhodoplanes sp. Z2-YC6860 TaxID=674703 RepID=UPI00078E5C61|nr:aldehyde dehydrogenase family protein [Rhodoplanes sp. Z2-YC6860]AMN43627.1 aldehyde dehydrogenase [Rhodoplanes sp. Z2-YC6860]
MQTEVASMTQIPDINSFIGEELPAGEGGFEWVRPQDGKTVGRIVEAGAAGVDAAVMAAKAAFQAHRLSPTHKRIALLKTGAAVLIKHAEELALLISEDVGKPIKAARFEARRGAEFLEATASALSQLASEVLPVDITQAGEGHFGFTRRHPYGVVAGVTPFNAPINLLIQKVAPAVAAGNAIITKPAPAAMRTSLRVAKLFQEAGWPKGLFTVLTGDKATATALVKHPDVRMISFTGGTAGGDALARAAGAKKFVAELGSNAANIVLADADIADAAKRIASAAFEASGQQCISAQRVLVDSKVLNAFVEKFVEAAKGLKVGRADDPATDVGPMVSSASADRVVGMCEDAIKRGARYVLEPKRDGAILSPGILVEVPQPARLWQEEVFGPIAIVTPFDDVDHALRLANDSPFGLQGAVFTRDLRSAFRFSNEFDVGSLWVNEASRFRLDLYPFGGMKTSGVGREGVRYAIEEFSQIKFTGIRY